MEKALLIAAIAGPVYLVMGLSVLIYRKQWQKILDYWEKDHFSLITLMLMHLVLGILVVNMYNVWEWNVWLLVTLTGWCMVVKGVFYMLAPGSWIKSLLSMKKTAWVLYLAGLVLVAMGVALSYYVYFAPVVTPVA